MKIIALEEHFVIPAVSDAWARIPVGEQDLILPEQPQIKARRYLKWALEVVGRERVMFATDYPYQIAPGSGARDFLEKSGLDAETQELIASGNWQRLTAQIK